MGVISGGSGTVAFAAEVPAARFVRAANFIPVDDVHDPIVLDFAAIKECEDVSPIPRRCFDGLPSLGSVHDMRRYGALVGMLWFAAAGTFHSERSP